MSTKSCSQCATAKPRSGFSETQLEKPAAVMRCLDCVAAGPAAAQTGPDAAPIEWLPGELLALVFGFVGAKTLTATIPGVSPCRKWVGGLMGGCWR